MRDCWLDDWALQLTGKKPLQRRERGSARPSAKRFIQDIQTSGKGVTVAKPCRHCAERKVTCIVHADIPFGRCLDRVRGVKGHMEWTECARSRGITNEEIISIGSLNLLVEEVWTYNFLDEPAGALKPRPVETVPVQSISTEHASTENAFNGPTTTKPPSISLYIEDRRALRQTMIRRLERANRERQWLGLPEITA